MRGHDPYPALAVDRHWSLISANDALVSLIGEVDPALMKPPVNVLRLSIHPAGLARRIVNFTEWRNHLVARLHKQVDATGDARLAALIEELRAYPTPDAARRSKSNHDSHGIVVPLQLMTGEGVLTLQHHHDLRHARRRDAVGTRHRGVLPGRSGDRPCIAASAEKRPAAAARALTTHQP